jgi:hypothetical protein
MTELAPSLVSKTISAITLGLVATMVHSRILPPTGVIALSISAAVVPGAKFWAWMVAGPAIPRIDKPVAVFGRTLN